jgi:hypothetical protein
MSQLQIDLERGICPKCEQELTKTEICDDVETTYEQYDGQWLQMEQSFNGSTKRIYLCMNMSCDFREEI